MSDRVLEAAAALQPPDLRSLDAIYLATALQLGADLAQLIAYDERLLAAATTQGIKTAVPR